MGSSIHGAKARREGKMGFQIHDGVYIVSEYVASKWSQIGYLIAMTGPLDGKDVLTEYLLSDSRADGNEVLAAPLRLYGPPAAGTGKFVQRSIVPLPGYTFDSKFTVDEHIAEIIRLTGSKDHTARMWRIVSTYANKVALPNLATVSKNATSRERWTIHALNSAGAKVPSAVGFAWGNENRKEPKLSWNYELVFSVPSDTGAALLPVPLQLSGKLNLTIGDATPFLATEINGSAAARKAAATLLKTDEASLVVGLVKTDDVSRPDGSGGPDIKNPPQQRPPRHRPPSTPRPPKKR